MRARSLIAAVLLMALGASSAVHAAPRARSETKPYSLPAPGTGDTAGACDTDGRGCVEFISGPRESQMELQVIDDMEWPIYFSVTEFPNQGALRFGRWLGNFCSTTDGRIEVSPDHMIVVWIWAGPDASVSCRGPATSGVVKARFYR